MRTLLGAAFTAAWITQFSGCTMPTQPGNLMSRITNSQDDLEEDLAEGERVADRESRWAEIRPPSEPEPRSNTALASHSNSRPTDSRHTESGAQQTPGLDAATLSLIQSELRDLPAPERQRWMEYLQTVDPRMVPHMLQARRMSMDATRPAQSASVPGATPGDAQQHIAGVGMTAQQQTGAMNQMRLNAPEPGGTSSMVITPSGGQSRSYPPSQQYVFNETPPRQQPQTPPQQAQGALPRISPGTSEHIPQAPLNDRAVMATNYESAVDRQNQPVAAGQDAYLQEALQRVIALTEAEVAALDPGYTEQERMNYLRRQVALRMLYFMSQQPHLAQQAIPGVSPSDQEFWTELFWAVSDYFDVATTPDPTERAALAAAQLESATGHLQQQARLELWNVSFSHKITSFGNFERYERDEFRAGQPVLLYAELKNFHSAPTNSGYFRTQLKSHIEIRRGGADGERIEYNSFPPTEDLCRAPRNDYFHSYKIELPHHLTPGPYALVLTVEDMLSGKVATEVLDFVIR